MRYLISLALLFVSLTAWALPSEVWIDPTYTTQNCDHTCGVDAFDNIQQGIENVSSYGIVHVAASVYIEQITIDRPVQLIGADPADGGPAYVILPRRDVPDPRNPIFFVDESEVTIRNIIFTGSSTGDSPPIQLDDPPMELLDDDPPPVDAVDDIYEGLLRDQVFDNYVWYTNGFWLIVNDSPPPLILEDPFMVFTDILVVDISAPKHGTITDWHDYGGFIYDPDPEFPGIDYFTYTIFDGITIDTATAYLVPIGITFTNRPSFTPGQDVTVNEDEYNEEAYDEPWATDISSGEGENDPLEFIVTFSEGTEDLFAEGPTIDPDTGYLSFVTNPDAYGTASYEVILSDGGWYVPDVPHTLTITVNPVNDQPSFSIIGNQYAGTVAGLEEVVNFVTIVVLGPDQPGNNEAQTQMIDEYLVTNNNPNIFQVEPSIDVNGKLSYTPAANTNGVAKVTVKLRDDGGTDNGGVDLSEPLTFTITIANKSIIDINNLHRPPLHIMELSKSGTAGDDVKVAPGQEVTLLLSVGDRDLIRYEGETEIQAMRPTPSDWPGNYTFTIAVTNAQIIVDGNQYPQYPFTATRDYSYAIVNAIIKVDNPLQGDVLIIVTVNDSIIIPQSVLDICPIGTLETACQDPTLIESITWKAGGEFPETISLIDLHRYASGNIDATYKFGPKDPAVYEGVLIDERFGEYTTNISLSHLTEAARRRYENQGVTTDIDFRDIILSDTGINGSFRINEDHEITDQHIGSFFAKLENDLNSSAKQEELWYLLPQWYLSNNQRMQGNINDYYLLTIRLVGVTLSYWREKVH
jgi:hypothetical protein